MCTSDKLVLSFMLASCEAGRCAVIDLLTRVETECTLPTDCKLRAAACCECGADTGRGGLIAIRADAENAYQTLVCETPAPACAECAPIYPPDVIAACSSGHCTVSYPDI